MTAYEFQSEGQDDFNGISLRDAADFFPDGVIIAVDGIITAANNSIRHMLQAVSRDTIIGRPLASLFPTDISADVIADLRELLGHPTSDPTALPTQIVTDQGNTLTVQIVAGAVESREGMKRSATQRDTVGRNTAGRHSARQDAGLSEWVLIVRTPGCSFATPVTKRDELRQLAWLQQMSVFGQIAASLVHDLGQPLTAAHGACDLLYGEMSASLSPEESAELRATIQSAVNSASGRFRRIWNFIKAGQPDPVPTRLDVVISQVTQLMSPSVRHSGVVLTTDCESLPPVVLDAAVLTLILTGLIQRSVLCLSTAGSNDRTLLVTLRPGQGPRLEIVLTHQSYDEFGRRSLDEAGVTDRGVEDSPESSSLSLSTCRLLAAEIRGILTVETSPQPAHTTYRLSLSTE
ncbi:MAG: PAS domain-containing protein [Planctomycetaceae bacterium]|nr:PAS domain-containing protein [Planctomycetaceae bacterium]